MSIQCYLFEVRSTVRIYRSTGRTSSVEVFDSRLGGGLEGAIGGARLNGARLKSSLVLRSLPTQTDIS